MEYYSLVRLVTTEMIWAAIIVMFILFFNVQGEEVKDSYVLVFSNVGIESDNQNSSVTTVINPAALIVKLILYTIVLVVWDISPFVL